MNARNHSKLKFFAFIVIGIGIVGILYYFDVFSLFTPEYIQSVVSGYGDWAPLAFMIIFTLTVMTVIPATPLNLAAGFLFGPWMGMVYAFISLTIGAIASFAISRFFGKSFALSFLQKHSRNFATYEKKLEDNAFSVVLFLRVVPIFPFFVPNYAFGLTSIRFRDYLVATMVGIIPSVVVYVYFGGALTSSNPTQIGLALGAVVLLVAILAKMKKRSASTKQISS